MSTSELGSESLVGLKDISSDTMVVEASTAKLNDQTPNSTPYTKNEPCSIRLESNDVDDDSSNESPSDIKIKEDRCPEKMVSLDSAGDDVARALIQRKQPLMELVSSEEGYVRRLKLVKDFYMPAVPAPSSGDNQPGVANSLPHSDLHNLPPTAPEDLAARWRIIWGNWIQLYEWHSAFLEKLVSLVDSDPDRIPKLFIDSRARLRSIYSKYCENHRKAALIAEQYRDFFEELRLFVGDKEDVVSHLMQPVQRIMRYQLPIAEILKYTQRACSPDLLLWKKTLEIMKEIPKDTQLILEAARIDGFPGVITALGNILLRSDLLVATTTREQLLETVTAYKMALQNANSGIITETSTVNKNPTFQVGRSVVNSNVSFSTDTSNTLNSSSTSSTNLGLLSPVEGCNSVISEGTGLFTGNLKFVESRLFLFEQMLLVTEEVKPKRRVTASDTFSQSTYQFKAAINVNKMRYESHWYNCSLSSGHANSEAATVDHLLCSGYSPDDLRFAILDQTPGKDFVYVIDPITCSNREAWVVQLRDIQNMQHEFLLALQDPRKFNTIARDEGWAKDALTCEPTSAFSSDQSTRTDAQLSISTLSNQSNQQRHKKWPSFTMKRPVRLGSNSSSVGTKVTGTGKESSVSRQNITAKSGSEDRPVCLARSLSAERQLSNREKLVDPKFRTCDEQTGDDICDSSVYRKSSQSANSSLKLTNQSMGSKLSDTIPNEANQHLKGGLLKKRNAFVNFFSRGKPKHRGKHQSQHQLVIPSGLLSGSEEHETVADCSYPDSDDRVCNSDVNLRDSPIKPTDNVPNVKSHALEYTTE
ncbi:Triple functional domain protein isoform 1 [Schistosoma japonicum]|uniref:Triple functional domain protein isoform 1 n=2 Tax=Schistosoma japonicum TaxID=6182 RepID=A0A4Z2D5R5_SCHJA|nr:Pleckstrin homology domain-containing family G member 4B [Schistosoma japonicum]KAH8851834.1 Pleckstrin homology domain-containing family G member 4B [Schistosoma japonicum]TNN11819.1 Triple functional domain protein isoform 1 [Schistosoma japonicum]TNN11820.1 Triple functional domain protein isoform 1 [Schistosoma japonicum]